MIALTGKQILLMAEFAGFGVKADDDDLEVQYTLDEQMKINIEGEPKQYNGMGIYCTEYPEEGALPLEQHSKQN